jgi:hypothetical protein
MVKLATEWVWSMVPPVDPRIDPVPAAAFPSGNLCLRSGRLKVVEPSPAP